MLLGECVGILKGFLGLLAVTCFYESSDRNLKPFKIDLVFFGFLTVFFG